MTAWEIQKLIMTIIAVVLIVLFDLYLYQALRTLIHGLSTGWRRGFIVFFWGITIVSAIGIVMVGYGPKTLINNELRRIIVVATFLIYFSKVFGVLTLLIDDIYRGGKWIAAKLFNITSRTTAKAGGITRSEFISKATMIAVAAPLTTFGFGIVSGAYNFRVRRATIALPNLPSAFDGIRIGQISDIHTGSFFSRSGVKKGVDLFLSEKPDIIFFTGDLVNDVAAEVKEYKDMFSHIKAPLGVFSTLGNHDYGDYRRWSTLEAKKKNFQDLIRAQKEMGWDLLMNENRRIRVDGEEIAIIGVENWGAGRFSKYGKLEEAYKGAEDVPVKLLLSHDPSHWDAQIRPEYGDIDVTFAGHTHGFQFGVEIGNFKWSPSQYIYKQWAGLYRENNQYLYVNRGFGFLGYPGRVGILPEVTIIELKKA